MKRQEVVKHVQKPEVVVTRDQLIDQICAQRGTHLSALRRVRVVKQ